MTERQVDTLLAPYVLQSGIEYWGGSGRRTKYYKIDAMHQFSVLFDGPADQVSEKGLIEPMGRWTQYDGDSIVVDVQLAFTGDSRWSK